MKNYKVIDNFLNDSEFNSIVKNTIRNSSFPIFLSNSVSNTNSNDGIYFTHNFIANGVISSDLFYIVEPILKKINPQKIMRIQFNLYPRTLFIKKHGFHKDYNFSHKGLIYYLNSNNGKTILKNKILDTKIKSIKNRALFFDPSKEHASTTCTNSNYRSNIIFNYL